MEPLRVRIQALIEQKQDLASLRLLAKAESLSIKCTNDEVLMNDIEISKLVDRLNSSINAIKLVLIVNENNIL